MFSDELEHYGILGMKWGIRRYQPYPKGKHGTFLGQSRDEDIKLGKGTEAYRVQAGKNISGTGQMYVSLDKMDHFSYLRATATKNGVAMDMVVGDQEKAPHSVKMELSRDILAPSYQKTMDTFVSTVDNLGVKNVANDLKTYQGKIAAQEFVKEYRHMNIDECRDQAYIKFCGTFMRNTKAKQMFFDSLKEQGYSAIVDDWDKQLGDGATGAPLILFEKNNSVKQKSSTEITKDDMAFFRECYNNGREEAEDEFKNAAKKWKKYPSYD